MRRAAALFALLFVVVASSAAATEGGPRFEACVGSGGGCGRTAAGPLAGAASLAVAPDGRHVYVGSFGADSVAAFAVGGGGELRFDGCVADASVGSTGCAPAPAGTLEGPAGLVASGGALFVASQSGDTVSRLALHDGGRPTFAGCVAAAGEACAATSPALRSPTGLVLGPGGRDLYVASAYPGTLTRLRVGGGAMSPAGCLARGGAYGCRRVAKPSLFGADAVAIAPDGRAAYAISADGGAITELGRSRAGALRYRGCVGEAISGCRPLRRGSLTGATGLAAAPDDHRVYVTSQVGTVSAFDVSAAGRLAFAGCLGDRGIGGCAPAPRRLLRGASGLAISADGSTLYLAAQGADALVELSVAGPGPPRLIGCVRSGGGHGCAAAPRPSLLGAYAAAIAPDGRTLLTASATGDALATFSLP